MNLKLKSAVRYIWHMPMIQKIIPAKIYIKIQYRNYIGKKLNLKNPNTFNEKLQWLKLYYRKPEYSKLVDKYEVREYIAKTVGENYLIPLIGVFDSYNKINFELLPNQFVMKPTHTSGDLFICKDKAKIDHTALRKNVSSWLNREYYWEHREWPYKNIKPRIIIENYMVDESGVELKDYKFFCFNGDPKVMFIATDRDFDTKFDFFDLDFNHLPFMQHYKNAEKIINKPLGFDEMIKLAKILAKDIPHVRVDFYNINGKIYFGELTFYHFSGLEKFDPESYDKIFGDWLDLSNLKYE